MKTQNKDNANNKMMMKKTNKMRIIARAYPTLNRFFWETEKREIPDQRGEQYTKSAR